MSENNIINSKTYSSKRYAYLAAGCASLMILGLLYGWSLFKAPLKEVFPAWTETNLATAFTILMCMYSVGGIVSGTLSKYKKPRLLFLAAAIFLLAGFVGASFLNPDNSTGSLIQLYLTYGLLGGFGTGIGYNLCSTLFVKYFPDRPGFAIGMLSMCYGLGAFAIGGLATSLIRTYGIFTAFRIIGIGSFVIFMIAMIFVKDPGAEYASTVVVNGEEISGVTPKEAAKSPGLWLILTWAVFSSAVAMIVVGNAASVILYFGAPGILGMLISVTNGISRILVGTLMDKFSFRKVSMVHNIILILSACLMLGGCLLKSVVILIIGILFTGLAFGGIPTSQAYYIKKKFGDKYYPQIYSFTGPPLLLATVLGTTLSGILQDTSPAGSLYTTSFILMVICAGISFVLILFLRKDVEF